VHDACQHHLRFQAILLKLHGSQQWRWVLPFGGLSFELRITQQTSDFVTCDYILEKQWIVICCTDEFISYTHMVLALLPHQHSWYILADMMHLQILTEDCVATTNWNYDFLCHHLYMWW
jgi:hypothetical protein